MTPFISGLVVRQLVCGFVHSNSKNKNRNTKSLICLITLIVIGTTCGQHNEIDFLLLLNDWLLSFVIPKLHSIVLNYAQIFHTDLLPSKWKTIIGTYYIHMCIGNFTEFQDDFETVLRISTKFNFGETLSTISQ